MRGPDGYLAMIGMMRSGFPDIQWTLEEMIAEDDMVAARFTMRGTHRGTFFGVPPTVYNRSQAVAVGSRQQAKLGAVRRGQAKMYVFSHARSQNARFPADSVTSRRIASQGIGNGLH